MRVKYINKEHYDPNLTLNTKYMVYSIEFSKSSNEVVYRIENNRKNIVPYPENWFEVCAHELNSWVFRKYSDQNFAILPKELSYHSFWESYYNDDKKARISFEAAKQRFLFEELSDGELEQIINHGNDEERILIFEELSKQKCKKFLNHAIKYSKNKLQQKENDIYLLSAIVYLSNFHEPEIEEFFIEYLTDLGVGTEDITNVINQYFAENK